MYSSLMFPHLGMNEEVVYVTDETFLLEVQKASPQEPEFASQLTVCEFWKHRNTLIDLDKVPVKFVLRPPKTQVSSDFMFFVQHVLVTHHYLTASLPSGCRFKVCMTHLLDLHVSFSFLRDCCCVIVFFIFNVQEAFSPFLDFALVWSFSRAPDCELISLFVLIKLMELRKTHSSSIFN